MAVHSSGLLFHHAFPHQECLPDILPPLIDPSLFSSLGRARFRVEHRTSLDQSGTHRVPMHSCGSSIHPPLAHKGSRVHESVLCVISTFYIGIIPAPRERLAQADSVK